MQFRKDIEGLRGIAVSLVVLFHIGVDSVGGGFVGVDVFFVISGFLISSQLLGELEASGGVRFAAFWARRFRRLMPLLALTVVGTLAAGLFVYSPLFWQQLSQESTSSVLYLSNFGFARDSVDYFQSGPSPLLHTWSLSVEEQFYAVWPLVFAVTAVTARRWRLGRVRALGVAVVVVSAASFLVALVLALRGSPWAFFSSATRAWEFGVGALVLFASRRVLAVARPVRGLLSAVGVGCIGVAAVAFDQYTDVPGPAALLPVLGTALVLFGGAGPSGRVGALLETRLLRSLGRVSYAWYLFHWPAVVLTAAAMQRPSRVAAAVACLAALGAAYLATGTIEARIRSAPTWSRPGPVYAATALTVLLVVGGSFVVQRRAATELREPYLAALVQARSDRSVSGSGDCVVERTASGREFCVYGDPSSTTTVLLFGDSHAAQWAPAFEVVAQQIGMRLVVQTRGGCPSIAVYVARTGDDRASDACLGFRAASLALMQELRPDVVVVANTDFTSRLLSAPDGEFLARDEALAAWSAGAATFARQVASIGSRLAVIEDNPSQPTDPIECLARDRSATRCSVTTEQALPSLEQLAEIEHTAFESVQPISVLRTAPLVCNASRCLVETEGVVVYSDANHLSREFILRQTDVVEQWLREVLSTPA